MAKTIIDIRSLAVLYGVVQHAIAEIEDPCSKRFDFGKGAYEYETEEDVTKRLSEDHQYQDLIRLREVIGQMNIEIETPDIEVVKDENTSRD